MTTVADESENYRSIITDRCRVRLVIRIRYLYCAISCMNCTTRYYCSCVNADIHGRVAARGPIPFAVRL